MNETEVDQAIEGSFPASDPPAWTPSHVGIPAGARPDLRETDLAPLLTEFYAVATVDDLLASYFAGVDMVRHTPRIVDFWSTMLFHTSRYRGSAFAPHARMPGLTGDHFQRWLAILEATVDSRFAGPNARLMKDLARRVAYGMQVRLGVTPLFQFVTPG